MEPKILEKFVFLVVLDGWGIAPPGPGNAISLASTVNFDRFLVSYPHTQLGASGESVGLPKGEAGNTETGHLNLGAGRIVYQDLVRINRAIADESFFQNSALLKATSHAKENNSNLHLIGLVGSAGVHSSLEHLLALIELAKKQEVKNLYLHLFTDGRDSPPTSAAIFISQIKEALLKAGIGKIASIMGRYWAMDRDQRWDRTARAYTALTDAKGRLVKTPEEAIGLSYAQGKTDEFIEPAIIVGTDGNPISKIANNDAVIFFNFRIDRPRQLSRAFVMKNFASANEDFGFDPYLVNYQKKHLADNPDIRSMQAPFDRGPILTNLCFVTMTEYDKGLSAEGSLVAFPPEVVEMSLGRVISEAGFRQLRCAESEKERFVTYYFNGQREKPFIGEERIITPSPKVVTYDLIPEMSARQLTADFLERIRELPDARFALLNFANVDMVGHTGNIGAAVKASEVVDECLGKLGNWILAYGGCMIITADHGNSEEMIDAKTSQIETEHSNNPVPLIIISKNFIGNTQQLSPGILADVAPTILKLLGIEVPEAMTGRNLLEYI